MRDLLRAGVKVQESFGRKSIKSQLRAANRKQIPWVLILGQKEAIDGTIIVRNMISGMQEVIDIKNKLGILNVDIDEFIVDIEDEYEVDISDVYNTRKDKYFKLGCLKYLVQLN